MLFNSIDFAIFLPMVFIVYWFMLRNHLNIQNLFLVIASYLFYGWWDYRFLALIIFSTLVDFMIGIRLSKVINTNRRKVLLWISIIVNIGLLGFFKYFNFFLDNFKLAFSFFGREIAANNLEIILPVGISFYTFQTMSYTIDVYRQKLEPTRNFVAFSAYVSFFPQLVAGPIERATNLLPQFFDKRVFDYQKAVDGGKQILWGLFKKMVIADNCSLYADQIFNNSSNHSGFTLVLGAIFFAFQIYGDFSGYSDIAIGTSRLFGFNLMRNFAFPYFSRDIAEFWRRWHISLSTWFRDYLYIPLGGSKGSLFSKVRNTFVIFLVSGFWHGANWTFIVWGGINALFFIPLLLNNKNRVNLHVVAEGKYLPSVREILQIGITFGLTIFAWIFFRAENISHALSYNLDLFSGLVNKNAYIQALFFMRSKVGISFSLILLLFIIIEWLGREGQYAISHITEKFIKPFRFLFYYTIIVLIILFAGKEQEFIYFQF
jgi:alginate O-acetyltransferase complex protein AlgI